MIKSDILAMLKANLEIVNSIHDGYFNQLIESAINQIKLEGYEISPIDDDYTVDDVQGIVMQAAYYYRDRTGVKEGYQTAALHPQGEPYMLRRWKNDHIFARKMST